MVVQVQVLSVASGEMAPCLLLATEAKRFLFDVGGGTQRMCMEHHVRLAKLQHVFLTELRTHTLGGLPGMILTVSDTGKSGLHVHGPPGTQTYLRATRHFLYRPEFNLGASDVPVCVSSPSEAAGAAQDPLHCCYSDDEVLVHAVGVSKPRAGAKRKLHASPSPSPVGSSSSPSESTSAESHMSVSYIVETREQRGKFLVQRAQALGVPKGKLFGQLHQGKDVTLADGRVVRSADCVSPAIPAAGCAIVSCPSVAHVDALVHSSGFQRFQESESEAPSAPEVQLEVVFHLAGDQVLQQPKYAAWTRRFGANVKHVLLGHSSCAQKTVYRASAKLQAQLHAAFPCAFPANEDHELRDAADPFTRAVPQDTLEAMAPLGQQLVLGESMLKFVLAPLARRGLDASSCWPRLDLESARTSATAALEAVAEAETTEPSMEELEKDAKLLDGRITFLGTGCAIPSKYRNVTGMYLELPRPGDAKDAKEDKEWAGMMLDCGEGSLGQLYRYANGDGQRVHELVDRLRCVWVSHNHADHHLGLLRVLSHRTTSTEVEPLLVVGPTPLQFWLQEYAELDPTVRGKFSFVDNYCFDESDERFSDVETHAQAAATRAWLTEALGVTQLQTVQVKHCFLSYALVLTFAAGGAKLAFSGDCRPSERLASAARGAFLMVHEATFEDDLAKEAKQKAHSTTSEAVSVGRRAHVRHLLLTHFSQRYPKMPELVGTAEGGEQAKTKPMNVLATIDMLSLRFRELRQPRLMAVCSQLMAQDEEDESDPAAEASAEAQAKREQRKRDKKLARAT